MKKTDYTKYSVEDIRKEIADKRDTLRTFRFGEAGSRSRNVREGRALRRDIARLMTALTARTKPSVALAKKSA